MARKQRKSSPTKKLSSNVSGFIVGEVHPGSVTTRCIKAKVRLSAILGL